MLRPNEPSQYASVIYSERLAELGMAPSVGSVGDSYDNAAMESAIGIYKTELIRRRGPWRTPEQVEFDTLEYIDWFNNRRLMARSATSRRRSSRRCSTLRRSTSKSKVESLYGTQGGSDTDSSSATLNLVESPIPRPLFAARDVPCFHEVMAIHIDQFTFGSIRIGGVVYEHDVVIARGRVRKRRKKSSKPFRDRFGHTPLSVEEDIPWDCQRLVVGTGAQGALPVMDEVKREAARREVALLTVPTSEAIRALEADPKDTNAILHVTC